MLSAILTVVALSGLVSSQHPTPCQDIFQYNNEQSEPGKWIGEVTLNSEYPLTGVWIKVVLDRKVKSVEGGFGETVTREPKEFLIKDRNYNLVPGTPLTFPLKVKYEETEPIPSLVAIRLNGRTVCPSSSVAVSNKCPGVLRYNRDKTDKAQNMWHGNLVLESDFELKGVWLRINLDRPAEILGNEFGEIKTDDNLSYLIHNRNHTLVPEQPLRLGFWVKYSPDGPVPNIQSVRLNGRTVCGDILAQDNNQNIIYYPLLQKYGLVLENSAINPSKTPIKPQLFFPIKNVSLKPIERPQQPIVPVFNPQNSSTTTTLRTTIETTTMEIKILNKKQDPVSNSTENNLDVSSNAYISCGTVVPESVNLIISGERAHSAQWPWHGAIYLVKPKSLDYICGMSLISELHALTAAHCVIENINTKKLRDPKTLMLYFGLLHRQNFTSPTVQMPTVDSIVVHEDYKISKNDIAVIKFQNKVKFTDWVRPVCLWEGDTDMRSIVNQTGTIVGFGVTETGSTSDELLYANILVVDTPTCIFSHRDFYSQYTSATTYCAGNLTQSAACNGDSGGAMVFRREGSGVWQVRGIVSTALRNSDTGLCDYNYYAIFTDAAQYTSWIEKVISTT